MYAFITLWLYLSFVYLLSDHFYLAQFYLAQLAIFVVVFGARSGMYRRVDWRSSL